MWGVRRKMGDYNKIASKLLMSVRQRLALRVRQRQIARFVLEKVYRVENLAAARESADFVSTRDLIRAAGTDSLAHFGNGYSVEGGLYLQQNPDEFAALSLFLKRHRPIKNYLEIGSASGGSCRFLYEQVGFERTISVDDGCHPRATEQAGNLSTISNVTRFTGDSHSVEARRFLAEHLQQPLDVAFIDGDHSYEGVWADIRLALAFSRPGTIFVFHDTVVCDGVERAWLEVIRGGLVKPAAEYIGPEKPLGIGVGMVR